MKNEGTSQDQIATRLRALQTRAARLTQASRAALAAMTQPQLDMQIEDMDTLGLPAHILAVVQTPNSFYVNQLLQVPRADLISQLGEDDMAELDRALDVHGFSTGMLAVSED